MFEEEIFVEPLILSEDRCQFRQCTFQHATLEGHFAYAGNLELRCSFSSCLFLQINVGENYSVIYFQKAAEGIQDRCCYSEKVSGYLYTSSRLVYESINSTICTNSYSWAPSFRCTKTFSSFFNNHSFFYRVGGVSCIDTQ